MDLAADVDFNSRYNMFAVAGFGHRFPLLVYVYERSDEELNQLLIMGKATVCQGPSYLNKLHVGPNDDRELMNPPKNLAQVKSFATGLNPGGVSARGGAHASAYFGGN